ncbi:MAG: hypothetical protein PHV33_05650 [Elusimicrobiales bacterium]|nr:hypothetical protein [Elusimicrobiales bacterium]
MSGENGKTGRDRLVDFRRLRLFVLYPLGALCGAYLLSFWLGPALDGFRIARDKGVQLRPLLEQARADRINYAQAAAEGAPAGKYVEWCVQNRSLTEVTVEGDAARRLIVSNYPSMPVYTGNKHQACIPMLLQLEKPDFGTVRVRFEEALKN